MPAQKIGDKWYSEELGRYFDPAKETSMGYKVEIMPSTPKGSVGDPNVKSPYWGGMGSPEALINAARNGDAQAIWDLSRINEAGNLPSQYGQAAGQSVGQGTAKTNQSALSGAMKFFLDKDKQSPYFMEDMNRLGYTDPTAAVFASNPGLLSYATPQMQQQQRQFDLQALQNREIQRIRDYQSNISRGGFWDVALPKLFGLGMGLIPGGNLLMTGASLLNSGQGRGGGGMDLNTSMQLQNIQNRYSQPSYAGMLASQFKPQGQQMNPFQYMPRPPQSGGGQNPFANFQQPQWQQPTRPQQPANQWWLNTIGR